MDLIYQVLKQATDLSNNQPPAKQPASTRLSPYEQDIPSRSDRSMPIGIVVPERTKTTTQTGSGGGSSGSSSGQSLHRFRSIASGAAAFQRSTHNSGTNLTANNVSSSAVSSSSNLTVSNPVPQSTSSGSDIIRLFSRYN